MVGSCKSCEFVKRTYVIPGYGGRVLWNQLLFAEMLSREDVLIDKTWIIRASREIDGEIGSNWCWYGVKDERAALGSGSMALGSLLSGFPENARFNINGMEETDTQRWTQRLGGDNGCRQKQ